MISVVLPTHNPNPVRLARVLDSLARQTLEPEHWEFVLVDNASAAPVTLDAPLLQSKVRHQVILESNPGLAFARRRGLSESRAPLCVFVDDDNVLAPDYLENARALMEGHHVLGALGGKSLPEFERKPEPWVDEFHGLLALRDLGDKSLHASWNREYPACAPIGAGMVLRREAARAWLESPSHLTDRRGGELSSGGDNDIVLCLLKAGWEVAYEPSLVLTHLIPAQRLEPDYLARLNHGIQKSWMRVLSHHGINPWPPIPAWTVPPRRLKAWLACRAWSSPAARIRWQGTCGHFEGRVQGRQACPRETPQAR
jgi:glycosyltransferase involved in cell wall biosynthesis